jgi:DNA-binding NarL/FixJ family response regulator
MTNPRPTHPVHICTGSDLTALAVASALRAAGIPAEIGAVTVGCILLVVDDYTLGTARADGGARRILLSHQRDPLKVQALMASGIRACLYLGDSLVERLPGAVRDVAAGGTYLSPTPAGALARLEHYTAHILPRLTAYQRDVLRLTADHWSAGHIAAHLGRTRTGIYQAQSVLRELFEVETNSQLVELLPDERSISA